MKRGTFYGVSVGPGDPELLTLQAVRILKRCPVLAAPETKAGGTLALTIARQAVDVSGKTILRLAFPMTRDEDMTRRNHQAQAAKIIEYLEQGQDVAMLSLGDAAVYSTFSYLMEIVKAAGYPLEMTPGVPSFCAAAAKLCTSLTEREEPLHIIPAGYGGVEESLKLPGAKVLMKPQRAVATLLQSLERQGLLESAAMVQNCGLPGEKVYPSLADFDEAEAGYFTTILVKGREKKGT